MDVAIELTCAPHIKPKARYVIETFLHVLGIRVLDGADDVPLIVYGHPTDAVRERLDQTGGIIIPASIAGEGFFLSGRTLRRDEVAYACLGSEQVPVLFQGASAGADGSDAAVPFDLLSAKSVRLPCDIVLSAFYFLSRWEEVSSSDRDQHDRFPYRASLASELASSRNVVDQYLDVFRSALNMLLTSLHLPELELPPWKEGRKFSVCLTHDIDSVRKRWPSRAKSFADILLSRGPDAAASTLGRRAALAWKVLSNGQGLRWTFPTIMSCEEEFGFRSSFYFQASRGPNRQCDYSVSDARVEQLLDDILQRGFEVGLHGSYYSAFEPERFFTEKRTLERAIGHEVKGHRQHYLRFSYQEGMAVYEESGLRYDSSLGFAENEGYRNQFSYPYHPYNHDADRAFSFLELPVVVMDATLYGYRRLSPREAWQTTEHLLEQTRDSRGCITILWHNAAFSDAEHFGYRQVYRQILSWIAEHNGIGTTGAEIADQWKTRIQGLRDDRASVRNYR